MTETSYLVGNGVAYKIQKTPCTNFGLILDALTADRYHYLGEFADGIHGGFMPNGKIITAKKLSFIRFNMRWELKYSRDVDGVLTMWHSPSPSQGQWMALNWQIPDGFNIYFVHDGLSYHLISTDDDGLTRRLPFPNIYNTGRLCTGRIVPAGSSIAARFASALGQWSESSWNTDLYAHTDQGRMDNLVRFNEDMVQIPPTISQSQLSEIQPEVDVSVIKRMMELEGIGHDS